MARIFYGMAGEGRGHATRVRTIVERLRGEHDITLFAPGAAHDLLKRSYSATDVRLHRIPGLLFHYNGGRLSFPRTVREAARYLSGLPRLVRFLEGLMRRVQPDLVVTDFEPALPRAAQRCGIPFVSLDHQHFLVVNDLSELPFSLRARATGMANVVKAYYSGQVETIVSSFYFPPLKPKYRDVVQTGVLLRPEVVAARPEDGDHLLVYLRRFADSKLLESLRQAGCEVRVYGLGALPADGNLKFFEVSVDGFLADLASCRALLSNAGNQLVGEALYLGKPVLVLPEAKNFEQFINAHFLRGGGGGDWVRPDEFDGRALSSFLGRLDEFRGRVDRSRIDGTPQALNALRRHLPASGTVATPARHDKKPVEV